MIYINSYEHFDSGTFKSKVGHLDSQGCKEIKNKIQFYAQ